MIVWMYYFWHSLNGTKEFQGTSQNNKMLLVYQEIIKWDLRIILLIGKKELRKSSKASCEYINKLIGQINCLKNNNSDDYC